MHRPFSTLASYRDYAGAFTKLEPKWIQRVPAGDAIRCDEDDDAHDTYDSNGNDDDNDNGGDTGNGKGDANDHYSGVCVWCHCFGHFSSSPLRKFCHRSWDVWFAGSEETGLRVVRRDFGSEETGF